MKKLSAFVMAAIVSAASLTAMPSSAYEDDGYQPMVYFTPQKSESFEILKSGRVYFNKSAASSDISTLNVNTYLRDDKKLVGGFIVKWIAPDEIVLNNISTPETLPYDITEKYYSIYAKKAVAANILTVNYPQLDMATSDLNGDFFFKLKGENSDDYPIAVFDADISKDTASGTYSIDFMTETWGNRTDIIYKPSAKETKEFFPEGSYAPNLPIVVSSYMLGDMDNSGMVDGSDATKALKVYASASSGVESFTTDQLLAGDVDGNGAVDGSDATLILKYYANLPDMSINDYVNEILK